MPAHAMLSAACAAAREPCCRAVRSDAARASMPRDAVIFADMMLR